MARQAFEPAAAPPAAGPYSHVTKVANLVTTAGQCGFTRDGTLSEGIVGQTRQALDNLIGALHEAGATEQDVIKVNVYLSDPAHFTAMNEIYVEYFAPPYPARTTVTSGLRPGVLVEFDALGVAVA